MTPVKKDADSSLVEAIRLIENQGDECFRELSLLDLPSNIAIWALLVEGIKVIEREMAKWGEEHPHFNATLLNASRIIPVAIKWCAEHGKPSSKLRPTRWTTDSERRAEAAFALAHNYCAFLTCLPMWHKDRYAAELISQNIVRFTVPATPRDHQVSAHQKGFQPLSGSHKVQPAKKPDQTLRQQALFTQVLQSCRKKGTIGFEYRDPWDLWFELLTEYQDRVNKVVRRNEGLSLGYCTLAEFKQAYAALLAVAAAHEVLCFAWERNVGSYPYDSCVLLKSLGGWADLLADISGISRPKCRLIVKDLTFDFSRSLDLHIHPFIPLDQSTTCLALAPQFPLHSRPDENILRVCSTSRPEVFSRTTLEKENEMMATLSAACRHFSPQGPISLPKPLPDIDLIVSDENSSTLVIAELKWIRKTTRSLEIIDRDADVLKGVEQLGQIQNYLIENPEHLRSQGKLPRPMHDYTHAFYLLIARDHWLWVEPSDSIAIVEFDAFCAALKDSKNLRNAIEDLLKYEWLPKEGRDFRVQYDRSSVNGVSIESQVFYSM